GDSDATASTRYCAWITSRGLDASVNDLGDGARVQIPARHASAEMRAPSGGERVVLRTPLVLGEPPLRFDEAAMLHAMQCRIQRAVFDLEYLVRGLANPSRDAEPVHRPPRERLENHHIERALQQLEVRRRSGSLGRHMAMHLGPRGRIKTA